MARINDSLQRRLRRKQGLRKRLFGTPERPRMTVYRSNRHIYAQIIDDLNGRTLVAAGTLQDKINDGGNVKGATEIGKAIGERAKQAGITAVAFDRNGFKYHGRLKALADAARETGLNF